MASNTKPSFLQQMGLLPSKPPTWAKNYVPPVESKAVEEKPPSVPYPYYVPPEDTTKTPSAAETATKDFTAYAAALPIGSDRDELYQGMLLLQRRYFLLANRLSFTELEPLHEAYWIAYRGFEDALYALDLKPPASGDTPPVKDPDDGTSLFMDKR
jgi:hypothetical protein